MVFGTAGREDAAVLSNNHSPYETISIVSEYRCSLGTELCLKQVGACDILSRTVALVSRALGSLSGSPMSFEGIVNRGEIHSKSLLSGWCDCRANWKCG